MKVDILRQNFLYTSNLRFLWQEFVCSGQKVPPPVKKLLAFDCCYLRERSVFFNGVDTWNINYTPGHTSHSEVIGQYKLDSMSFICLFAKRKKENMKLDRQGGRKRSGRSWGGEWVGSKCITWNLKINKTKFKAPVCSTTLLLANSCTGENKGSKDMTGNLETGKHRQVWRGIRSKSTSCRITNSSWEVNWKQMPRPNRI